MVLNTAALSGSFTRPQVTITSEGYQTGSGGTDGSWPCTSTLSMTSGALSLSGSGSSEWFWNRVNNAAITNGIGLDSIFQGDHHPTTYPTSWSQGAVSDTRTIAANTTTGTTIYYSRGVKGGNGTFTYNASNVSWTRTPTSNAGRTGTVTAITQTSYTLTTNAIPSGWTNVFGHGTTAANVAETQSSTTVTAFSTGGLSANTTYYWAIQIYRSGARTVPVTGSVLTLPNAPTGGSLDTPTSSGFRMYATAGTGGCASFDYYVSTSNTAPTAATGATVNGASGYTWTGGTGNTLYYVWVRARNASGVSEWISIGSLRTVPNASVAPTINNIGVTQFDVSVPAVANITRYEFYVSASSTAPANGSSGVTVSTTTGGAALTVTGLNPGTMYYVWARYVNESGTGAWSSVSSARTLYGGASLWNGSTWVTGKVHYWNGSTWAIGQIKFWNGSAWVQGK